MKKILMLGAALWAALFAQNTQAEPQKELKNMNQKILIAYYSYSGNTKEVAQAIQSVTGGDLFEIKAKGTYPDAYRPMTVQAKKEIEEGFRPELLSDVDNISQYDVIFLGSPNWWGTITPQVSSFIEKHNLSGKTIIPFITHGGGGVQNTVKNMSAQCEGCNVKDNAWVGYGNSVSGLEKWLKTLGFEK